MEKKPESNSQLLGGQKYDKVDHVSKAIPDNIKEALVKTVGCFHREERNAVFDRVASSLERR